MKITNLYIALFFLSNSFGIFAQHLFNVEGFGVINDGVTLNTKSIQDAIDAAYQNKGGTVVFPAGKYLTGTIYLKSGVHIYLEENATILGSTDPFTYEKLIIEDPPTTLKTDDNSKLALIIANKAKNISISGKGIINGQGRKLALNIDSLHHKGIRVDPNYGSRVQETMRPKIINFWECENVKISDITILNSSSWVQTYELCKNVTIENIRVISRAYWNNDGINITDSKEVKIHNCYVDAADDAITLKSYYTDALCEDIEIKNCEIRSSASAIKFGTASFGGFKDIRIDSIKVVDTYRSAIAIESVDGGTIENVVVSNMNAINTGNAIFVRLGHRAGDNPGKIENITFKNIKAQIPFGRPDSNYDLRGPDVGYFHNQWPASITGIPNHSVKNITLENIEISYPGRASKGMAYVPLWRLDAVPENSKNYPEYTMFGELPSWGFYIRHAEGITFKNIVLKLDDEDFRPAIIFDDVKDIGLENIQIPEGKNNQIVLKEVQNIISDEKNSVKIQKQ